MVARRHAELATKTISFVQKKNESLLSRAAIKMAQLFVYQVKIWLIGHFCLGISCSIIRIVVILLKVKLSILLHVWLLTRS